ncbi:hypothetical protein [Xanthomarina spongicola]|uniref:Transglutaminase superfamily protein n=1 Tax=Xanthomarina spongicola TaxID=570520 RepID=A0A316DRH0_9FLAO|nr:hypothetical protein [Xanthomarina spongicola]PWK19759.1 hypothetical protein LX78_01109 [Xanthomarina spongicola]
MDNHTKFVINSKEELSQKLIECGVNSFDEALTYIKKLPYGRNTNRSDYRLVLKEQKGTCSTKHAFLAEIARQNNITNVKLFLGIYNMCEENTQGVGSVLKKWQLTYLPEAHCYLKINNIITDITSNTISSKTFEESILIEEEITPNQIGSYKEKQHQFYLRQWIIKESINYTFESIWKIREACIKSLSQ